MSSSSCFREFLNERLSAAAEEIFRVFEQTVLEYQEEISRQRRMLDRFIQPESKRQQKEIIHFSVHDERVDEKNLCDQDGLSGLDLNDLEASQIKEEEELWTSLKDEQERNESDNLPLFLENQGSDEEKLSSSVSVVVIKSDREDSGLPIQSSHRDLNREDTGTHASENLFHCDTCGKSFTKMPLLRKHMITHTGLKPFVCEVCGKDFNLSSNREAHMKTHSMEKPYTCDVCGKAFSRSADLKRHSRCHTGEKPYSCSFCAQVFPYHTSLKNHLRRHTGEKPYRCMWCGKGFTVKASMKIHTRIHTGERRNNKMSAACSRNKNVENDF